MGRLALKSLLANKIRFALTAGTVVIGVGFVVSAFVIADSLRSSFDQLSTDIVSGTDFTVRSELEFGDISENQSSPLPEELLDRVAAQDGVAAAAGTFFVGGVVPVDGSGSAVTTSGPPIAGTNWTSDEGISQLYLIEGERPQGPGEFGIDVDTYENYDFELGLPYQVVTPTGPRSFELVAVMQFGFPDNAGLGAVFSIFDTATAQEVFGLEGLVQQIGVRAEPGIDTAALQAAITAVLPDGVEVITAEASSEELSNAFEGFIGPFQNTLLAFAFIVLFVSAFIISNTFNIVLGQRVRELSLIRAIGATPGQVRRSVLTESLLIGVVAVIFGIGLGMIGAVGLRELFSALGAELPAGGLPLRVRTILWALLVGIGLTVVASLLPAIKASRTSPIAGLSAAVDVAVTRERWRPVVGSLLGAIGLVLTLRGLFASFDSTTPQLVSLGAGAALVFVAVAVLSPLMARRVVSLMALPLGWVFGTAGRLARANAARSPRRTAATAVTLTIGLALVSTVAIVGQSLKDSFGQSLQTAVVADFIITDQSQFGLPATLATELRQADIGRVVGFSGDQAQVNGETKTISAADMADIESVANLGITSGSLDDFDPTTGLLMHRDPASDLGLDSGDELTLTFVNGDSRRLTVAAIYSENAFWGNWLIDRQLLASLNPTLSDDAVAVASSDVDPETARLRIEQALAGYPQADLEDRSQFQASNESQLNTLLTLVNVFLGFALLIALVGIVNTLTLSVFERTREIGLLRAVGMTRRQARRMIRWEAAIVTLYGALIGIGLGVAFGVAIVVAIPADIIGVVTVPINQLVLFVVVSMLFGLLAALFPAYRASRLDVLTAIAED